jgi:hypothetical protein
VDVTTESGPANGASVEVNPGQWVAAEFTVTSGTQLTGLELAVVRSDDDGGGQGPGGRDDRSRRDLGSSGDLVVSLWNASPEGLPETEIVSANVGVRNGGDCSDRRSTEVDLFNPPAVKPGEKLFVALGSLAFQYGGGSGGDGYSGDRQQAGDYRWCEYRGSSPQVVAFSSDQGSRWTNASTLNGAVVSGDPVNGDVASLGDPELGFADYVTNGPAAVTPETPIGILLPVVGAGLFGGAVLTARRRRTRVLGV